MKSNNQELKELSFLKDWSITILDFFISKYGNDPLSQTFQFLQKFYETVLKGFDSNNLRGSRLLYQDLNDWAKDLPPKELEELNQILLEKFGFNLKKYDSKNSAKIKRIIKRGTINNDDEYRLLLDRVDEIYADENTKDEVDILNGLLADYDKRRMENR